MEPNSSSRADRKTIEKNRRSHMKSLYSKLNSLVPHRTHKEVVSSLPDQLHEAARYIKTLQMKLEKMREKKEALMLIEDQRANNASSSGKALAVFRPPQIDIREVGSALQVVLVTGLNQHKFMFNETIRILHGEGAEVVNATYSVAEDAVFHTIHAKVGESNFPGYGATRISERLQKFVHAANYSFD